MNGCLIFKTTLYKIKGYVPSSLREIYTHLKNYITSQETEEKPPTSTTPYNNAHQKKKSVTPEHPILDQVVSKPALPEATVNLLCEEDDDLGESEKQVVDVSDRYRFIFSGLTPHEKIDYAALVERLGAKYLDAQYFNSNCTHVVAGNPSRQVEVAFFIHF